MNRSDLRTYLKSYLNKSHLTGSLLLSVAALLTSCSNTTPLINNNMNQAVQSMSASTKTLPNASKIKSATPMAIDWQHVESQADDFYKNHPEYAIKSQPNSDLVKESSPASLVEKWYAKSFGVSEKEARQRLILQSSSQGVIEAIEKVLGDAFVAAYYVNEHPDEFRLGVTTTHTINASSYTYTFKDRLAGLSLPIYLYPISDKTKAQIFALQEKATPEVFKRYPNTQSIGFSPMSNTITVSIYSKTMSESERKRLETELTELVGHSVTVEMLSSPITVL